MTFLHTLIFYIKYNFTKVYKIVKLNVWKINPNPTKYDRRTIN